MRNLIIKRSQLIIGLLLITGFAHGQLKDELAWQVIQASDKKRSIQLTDDLNRNGFKVELSLLQNGRLQLQISDPRLLAKVLKKRFFVELKNDADTLLTLNGLEIKSQLIGQYYLYQNPGSMRDSAEMANEFDQVIKGKSNSFSPKQTAWYIDFGVVERPSNNFIINFYRKEKLLSSLRFSPVTGDIAQRLPERESQDCIPVDRFMRYKNLQELNEYNMTPLVFPIGKGRNYTRIFVLNFKHNKYTFNQPQVESIKQYLQDSSVSIRRAYIRGMSSIEGDSVNNAYLQRKRASILWNTLKPFAEQGVKIEGDYQEAWLMFRTQLSVASIDYFDSLTNNEIRDLFNNREIRDQYEDFLSKQRIAKLYLNLHKPYTQREKISLAIAEVSKHYTDLLKAEYNSFSSEARNKIKKSLAAILGVEEAIMKEVDSGLLSADSVIKYYPFNYHMSPNLAMARLYYLKRNWDRRIYPTLPNAREIITAAHEAVLPTIKSAYFNDKNIPLRKAVDVQILAYRMIKNGVLDTQVFYDLNYEDSPRYFHLEMNKLYYKQYYLQIDEEEKILVSNEEEFIPTPAQFKASRYYFYLKKWLIDKDNTVKSLVVRGDGYYFLDLYDLLYFNVEEWDVYTNQFYDDDVTIEIMNNLLKQIYASRLCLFQKYQMLLEFHRKVLLTYLDDKKVDDQFFNSYNFIAKFYKSRSKWLTAREAETASRFLVFINNHFYHNEPISDAYDIMKPHFSKAKLDNRGEEFFFQLSDALGKLKQDYGHYYSRNIKTL